MAEVVVFPSVLGVRDAIRDAATRFEAAGHRARVVDLYRDGRTFDSYEEASGYLQTIGGPGELAARTRGVASGLPAEPVCVGFSVGGAAAELVALTHPGVRGVLLPHASLGVEGFGAGTWPTGVPAQVHYAEHDPFRDQDAVDSLADSVRAAGGQYDFYEYPVTGHLFTDPGLPEEYDETATNLLYERALRFLAQLDDPHHGAQSPVRPPE